jgi:hypothetical protein
VPGFHLKGGFVRERLRDPVALRRRRYRFRTRLTGTHRVVLAFPPGRRQTGAGVLQAILHPRSEAHGHGAKFVCRGDTCRRIREEHGL